MNINAEQVGFEAVVFDQRVRRSFAGTRRNPSPQISPIRDGQAADVTSGADGDDAARAAAVEHRARPPAKTIRRSILSRLVLAGVSSMTSPSCARSSSACNGCSGSLQRRRNRGARNGGEDRRRKDAKREHVSPPSQADGLGSTNMRPFISMCMA
jgi:hypothetical protein